MNPLTAVSIVLALLIVSAVTYALLPLVREWRRARGVRLVTCPETHAPVAVELDATDAAFHAFLGTQDLHLKSCTRWPERQGCGQECLAQIQAAPDGCLVRSRLAEWYDGRTCALCGQPFGHITALDHKPAFLGPDRVTREWGEVRVEDLPELFASNLPVCWDCHIVESLYRTHPELVVERPGRRPKWDERVIRRQR